MKYLSSLMSAGLIAMSTSGLAQSGGMKDMDMKDMHGTARVVTYKAEGTLKRIDAAAGTVMMAHGPVPALKWPPMTMSFEVRDDRLLQGLKPGQRVQFEFVMEGKRYIIISIDAGGRR